MEISKRTAKLSSFSYSISLLMNMPAVIAPRLQINLGEMTLAASKRLQRQSCQIGKINRAPSARRISLQRHRQTSPRRYCRAGQGPFDQGGGCGGGPGPPSPHRPGDLRRAAAWG